MKLRETNNNWNDCKLKLHQKNLDWADLRNQYRNKKYLCPSTFRYYIKDKNKYCNFVGHSKLEPIEYNAFFKCKYFSAALASIVRPDVSAKASDNAASAISTSVQKKYL